MKVCAGRLVLIAGLFICLLVVSLASADATSVKTVSATTTGGEDNMFTVALTDDGTLWAWGINDFGVIGPGNITLSFVPVKLDISGVKDMVAGSPGYVLILKDDGTVWGWGYNYSGCLGNLDKKGISISNNGFSISPIMQIHGISNVTKIATGYGQCFAIESNGSLWAWGYNGDGELGIGNNNETNPVPVKVDIDNVEDIACTATATVLLKNDGTVWASGDGEFGIFGNGSYTNSNTFIQVPISNVKAISCGNGHILALKNDGTVWSWGNDWDNQTGSTGNKYQSTPKEVQELDNVTAISAGGYHSLALKNDGTVWVWGDNEMGIYGNGSLSGLDSIYPVEINSLKNIEAITAGYNDNFAIADNGTLWGWGFDGFGAVGVGALPGNASNQYGLFQDNGSVLEPWRVIVGYPTQVLFDQPDRMYYPIEPTLAIEVASGVVLIAGVFIMVKFIGIGAVTRARSRIDKNDNRNRLLQYVIKNPGLTIYDISKAMSLNRGTVRYHLLILDLNHRITTFKDDNKYIRYFPNSNRYSKEEQLLISMIRRDPIKRVIQLLYMKPGLTNSEISNVTGLIDSGVSRYIKELCDKGIVTKVEMTPGRYAYSLTEAASKTVEKLYWVVNGEDEAQALKPGDGEA